MSSKSCSAFPTKHKLPRAFQTLPREAGVSWQPPRHWRKSERPSSWLSCREGTGMLREPGLTLARVGTGVSRLHGLQLAGTAGVGLSQSRCPVQAVSLPACLAHIHLAGRRSTPTPPLGSSLTAHQQMTLICKSPTDTISGSPIRTPSENVPRPSRPPGDSYRASATQGFP